MTQLTVSNSLIPGDPLISEASIKRNKKALESVAQLGDTAITHIAEYAGKLDPARMNVRFWAGVGISSSSNSVIDSIKRGDSDCSSCLTSGAQPAPSAIADNTNPIGNTPERTCLNFIYILSLQQENPYALFDLIEGIERLDLSSQEETEMQCIDYAFRNADWYSRLSKSQKSTVAATLLGTPGAAFSYLLGEPGYSYSPLTSDGKGQIVRKGQIIGYARPQRVTHYGIIDSVNSNGTILVDSKLGFKAPAFRHTLPQTLYLFGQGYFLLDPPPEAPSK